MPSFLVPIFVQAIFMMLFQDLVPRMMCFIIVATATLSTLCYQAMLQPLYFDTLSSTPGLKIYALTKWQLAWDDWTGQRTHVIYALHLKYGRAVRITPNELHFHSLLAFRTIYGAGSGFERTSFYGMFDVYGRKNLFTFASGAHHAQRKRLLARSYSKSGLGVDHIIHNKVRDFLELVDNATKGGREGIWRSSQLCTTMLSTLSRLFSMVLSSGPPPLYKGPRIIQPP